MVRYTASEVNLLEFAEKRKTAQSEQDRPESPSDRGKSPNGIFARRKIRKFFSGDQGEPVDELDMIGFQVEVDVSLVFESNRVFYAHFNCALWSGGVLKSKMETETEKEGSTSSTPLLKFVSQAVLNGITTRLVSYVVKNLELN
jgi:hypothetical protein